MSQVDTSPKTVQPSPTPTRAGALPTTPLDEGIRLRVRAACQGMPYRTLARLTAYSEETIRRYMHGHKPAAAFLARICHAFEISPAWMLLGHDAPLARPLPEAKPRGSGKAADTPEVTDVMEANLDALAAHIAALRHEIDRVARPGDESTRAAEGNSRAAAVAKRMKTHKIRSVRLLLGPADGRSVAVEQLERLEETPGEEVAVYLDPAPLKAWLVEPGKALMSATKVYRYERAMPEVYTWIDPVNKRKRD